MSNNPFSFEYGEEEEEKRPQPSVKKRVNKINKKVELPKKEEKPSPLPEEPSPVAVPEQASPVVAIIEPVHTTSTVIVETKKQVEKQIDSDGISPAVVGAVAVVATAVAAGPTALAKLKSLRTKGKSVKSKQAKQEQHKQEKQKQEEKKKEEQTKCDAKSQEVQSLIDETNKAFDELSVNIESFFEIRGDKELNKLIDGIKDELKKTKKLIKNLD